MGPVGPFFRFKTLVCYCVSGGHPAAVTQNTIMKVRIISASPELSQAIALALIAKCPPKSATALKGIEFVVDGLSPEKLADAKAERLSAIGRGRG